MKATSTHRAGVATIGAAVLLVGLTSAPPAMADATCIAAYEQTQTLRKDGKPSAAKVQAAICAKDSCPALLTKDCSKWLSELEPLIPSVVLDPRGPTGNLRADVRVKLDGAPVTEKIEGKPLALEPGSHTFVFDADGVAPVERTIVVREGEKNKKLTVTIAPPIEPVAPSRPIPIGVWIFGALSVVALASATVFAVDGLGKRSDLDKCKPYCAADDVDSMSTQFTFADVALGAGVMAGAAAAYLFFSRPSSMDVAPTSAARSKPVPFATPLPGGGAVGLTAHF